MADQGDNDRGPRNLDGTKTYGQAAPPEARRIGPYRVLRELGQGGMGTVYLAARADEQYEKRVAIKVIRAGMDNQEVLRHFRRERQILASLDHPNIARLLDGGATDEGLPYFVMEFVQGQAIDEYCDRASLSVPERLKLFRAVCSAIQYAHRNLIVHRDIKPSNVVVTAEGVPKLLDFGIAKFLNPELSGKTQTVTRMAMTPEYASPEQARGEPITTATDVYSLGVVLYKLLTGHHPYRVSNRPALEVLRAVIEEEPERPSTAINRTDEAAPTVSQASTTAESVSRTREGTPERLRRRLHGDVDNIVLMALRKEPQRRYPSVEAFSEDIRRYLEGRPVTARRGTFTYRTGKFLRRNRIGVGVVATIFALLAAFGATMAAQSRRVSGALERAEKERAKAEKVSGFLVDLFKVSDPSEAKGNAVTAREMLDKGAAKIETELKDQPEVRATLMDTMGNVYRNLGLYDKALPLLQEALKTRKGIYGNEHPEVATSLNNLASILEHKGDYAAAEPLYREALAMRRKLLGSEHPDVARSLNNLANILDTEGNVAAAEPLYREALAMRRKLFGEENPEVARSLNNLAIVLREKGDYAGAEALQREALAMKRKLLGNDHQDVTGSLNNLANVLDEEGKYAEAEALYREVLARDRKLLGNEHPDLAMGMNNLAGVLREKGDYAGAEGLHREALAMRRKLLGNEHPDTAESLTGVADAVADKGDYATAEPLYREALAVQRKVLGDEHLNVGESLVGLADALCHQNKPLEGAAVSREALAIRQKALPRGHPDIAETESVLGGCLVEAHRYDEAESLLLGSYPILKAKANPSARAKGFQRIVRLYQALGKPDKAAEYRALLVTPPAKAASTK
jgi:serine/threonine protein kinase/tetratricopeptide (TPR) repeat protein